MSYGFGFSRWGMWFGLGQVRFRRWAIDICLFKQRVLLARGWTDYARYWWTVP